MKLLVLALLLLPACYEPSLKDCTVTCAGAEDCIGGEVCGAQGFCVADLAARCSRSGDLPDAPAALMLHVVVMGDGRIDVDGGGPCRSDCRYAFYAGDAITARWVETTANHAFTMWTSSTCAGQDQTCRFTMSATTTTVGAKFE